MAVLELLDAGPRPAADLAEALGAQPEPLGDRLADMADNDLVAEREDGRFERTPSGRRALRASADGTVDDRVDTSEEVERAIDTLGLERGEADAVRGAFALVKYWGGVTGDEIVDAVYSEVHAGYDSQDAWWTDCVGDALAELPDVEPPEDPDDPDGTWRYDGVPGAADPGVDGRRVLDGDGLTFGSVKHTVESLDCSDAERDAVHAAFSALRRRGKATEGEIADAVYAGHPAGHSSAGAWWDGFLRDVFAELPGVERTGEAAWVYRPEPTEKSPEEAGSSDSSRSTETGAWRDDR